MIGNKFFNLLVPLPGVLLFITSIYSLDFNYYVTYFDMIVSIAVHC